jgi:hypothetical protein
VGDGSAADSAYQALEKRGIVADVVAGLVGDVAVGMGVPVGLGVAVGAGEAVQVLTAKGKGSISPAIR